MSEEGSGTTKPAPHPVGGVAAAWVGGIIGLGVLAIISLFAYGDPRPTFVDTTTLGDQRIAVPPVVPGQQYYRIQAEFVPLPDVSETDDPMGQLWASMFGEAVSKAGIATVKLRLSHPAPLSLPRDSDGYLILDVKTDSPTASGATPFILRRASEQVELRLDVEPVEGGAKGLMPALLRSFGGSGKSFSGWISVFAEDSSPGSQKLDATTSVMPVRDYSGRAVGAVRVSLEAKNSMLFGAYFTGGEFERMTAADTSIEARRNAVLALIQRNIRPGFGKTGFKQSLQTRIERAFDAAAPQQGGDTGCASLYTDLRETYGLSPQDAAGIAFLTNYDPTLAGTQVPDTCDNAEMVASLNALGATDGIARLQVRLAALKPAKQPGDRVVESPDRRVVPSGRYVCLDVSGPRIAGQCDVLNQIAREWRGGSKFLQMSASRQFISPYAGLEEPTESMGYSANRFSDRRQLLIHIALSRVENFACFRMVRQNPSYFEALLMMRDAGGETKRRLDVFEFAFESDGTIGRIRRRAALPSDVEAARQLPETSRCRREFLDVKERQIQSLVRQYWRLPSLRS